MSDTLWKGRDDASEMGDTRRLFQIVRTDPAGYGAGDAVLLGFASDAGVRRNHGRPGASRGPEAIRRMLANLPTHDLERFWDVGDVVCEGDLLETAQQAQARKVSAVLAYVPSALVHSGQNAADPAVGREGPTWLLRGEPLPHQWQDNRSASWAPFDEGPAPHRHELAMLTALQDEEAVARARIPVEKIAGPVLVTVEPPRTAKPAAAPISTVAASARMPAEATRAASTKALRFRGDVRSRRFGPTVAMDMMLSR